MTAMQTSDDPRAAAHQRVQELLPWYINRSLDERESDEVAKHLATCPSCERDAARSRSLAAVLSDRTGDAWSLPPDHLSRTLARLTASEAPPLPRKEPASWIDPLLRAWEWLSSSPVFLPTAMAVQFAVIAALGAALFASLSGGPADAEFRTLTSPPASAPRALPGSPGGELGIRAVFAAEITEGELRALLRSERATLSDGPSSVGAYTIVTPGEEERARLLERLRAHPRVRLAEPLRLDENR